MTDTELSAPGAPGIAPTWTSSDKDMVGCALGTARLWFTVGHGIVNEVYYPRVDIPQIRDLGFIVSDGQGFWVEVKRLTSRSIKLIKSGIPAVSITHQHARFQLHLRICPDPKRDTLLVQVRLEGDAGLRPYVLLNPHLGGTGQHNRAWATHHHGRSVLWAEQGPFGLALLARDVDYHDGLHQISSGCTGVSDGWQDFSKHGAMRWHYQAAGPGNVALTGALAREATLALGLSSSKQAAATLAAASLQQSFESVWQRHIQLWDHWHRRCEAQLPHGFTCHETALANQFRTSAMVLRSHLDHTFPGAMVASLSIPWGNRGEERGGYHLVWPRDLVECAGALLALGALEDARDILRYLIASQLEDGHWYQNQWLGGKPYWGGVQLDEAAFPVLLAAAIHERQALNHIGVSDMVQRALGFIALNGPASDQDRWEEDAGVNAFTLAACIAALVSGAIFLDKSDQALVQRLADFWNANIENWTVARATDLAKDYAIPGYYVRISPRLALRDQNALMQTIPIKNRLTNPQVPANEEIGVDFLQLVRFGLRKPDDPLVQSTLKVVDALLKVETPFGPSWHRYNGDGYGEAEDGSAYNGIGVGRAWPLLTGERGHYELAAGRDPTPFLEAMAAMAGGLGMLPEQVWDAPAIERAGLSPGRPTGSAMPLAWAHAEFIKLVVSRHTQRVFDRPDAVWRRYHGQIPRASHAFWSQQAPISRIDAGQSLVILLPHPAVIHVGSNGWQRIRDISTRESGLGVHWAEIDFRRRKQVQSIEFTWRDTAGHWHGSDYVLVISGAGNHPMPSREAPHVQRGGAMVS